MIEQLTTGGDILFSNSGPGSKKIFEGNRVLGYMGTVAQREVIPIYRLQAALDLPFNPIDTVHRNWIKVACDGKALFIPNQTLGDLSLKQIYELGLLWGGTPIEDQPDVELLGLETTNQDRFINTYDSEGNYWVYRVRMLAYSNPMMHSVGEDWEEGEASRIYKRLDTLPLDTGVKWPPASITGLVTQLTPSASMWDDRFWTYNTGASRSRNPTTITDPHAWVPVFEIVDSSAFPKPLKQIGISLVVPGLPLEVAMEASEVSEVWPVRVTKVQAIETRLPTVSSIEVMGNTGVEPIRVTLMDPVSTALPLEVGLGVSGKLDLNDVWRRTELVGFTYEGIQDGN